MTDLRMLPRLLVDGGDVVTPPVAVVARRARHLRARRAGTTVVAVVLLLVLAPSVVQWITDGDESSYVRLMDRTRAATEEALPGSPPPAAAILGAATDEISAPTSTTGTATKPLECRAGANGGATDRGVTSTSLRIVMTETLEFPTRYVTATAYASVRHLFEAVNLRGGICGRLIDFRYANDAWRPLPWDADADMVASIAGPLDTNVDVHILDGSLNRVGVPLVGTDGRTVAQHRSPWVWPVGPPTASLTRIAVDHAYRSSRARTFAIVYDKTGPVGTQAAAAFEDYVKRLPGATTTHMQALDSSAPEYGREAAAFNARCSVGQCDFVFLALFPETATKWMAAKPAVGKKRTATLPLLTDARFWRECPKDTHPQTDFRPKDVLAAAADAQATDPREPYDSVRFIERISTSRCSNFHLWHAAPEVDLSYWSKRLASCTSVSANPSVAVAELSACTIIEALERTGPNVTRARLRQAIDEVAAGSGLARAFRDGRRTGRAAATPWKPRYSLLGDFQWLEDAGVGKVADPLPDWEPPATGRPQ